MPPKYYRPPIEWNRRYMRHAQNIKKDIADCYAKGYGKAMIWSVIGGVVVEEAKKYVECGGKLQ